MAINKIQKPEHRAHKYGLWSKGMSLVELLVVVAVVTVGLVYLLGIFSFSLRISGSEKELVRANLMAQEAIEGVRNFRDGTDWEIAGVGTLATSTSYHLEKSGSPPKWALVLDEKTTDGFTQKIVFEDVKRDLNSNIVESGGDFDSDTKKITVTVSWIERGKSKQIELVAFLTNWNQ